MLLAPPFQQSLVVAAKARPYRVEPSNRSAIRHWTKGWAPRHPSLDWSFDPPEPGALAMLDGWPCTPHNP